MPASMPPRIRMLASMSGARIMRCTSIMEKVRIGIAVRSTSRMMIA